MIELEQAERFLNLLEKNGEFTFQTFADSNQANGPGRYARVLHGSLAQHQDELARLNDAGAGIFVMVNAGDGVVCGGEKTCRTAANVVRVRAVFADLDGAPLLPVLEAAELPDWIVQSSPDRWHAYWLVDDCPLPTFATMQRGLIAKFESDASVTDLPRVMRLPGFVHRKTNAPFVSKLYLADDYASLMEACRAD